MNTNRNSAYQSNNEDNFATFSLGLDFLNQAEKEQNTPSRFASLSESEMDQILKERHSNKTKQMTNCSISAFKGFMAHDGKISVRNLQYGPRTRLVRGMYNTVSSTVSSAKYR